MRAHLLVLGALAACSGGRGMVDAQWTVAGEELELDAPGQGGWCQAGSVILVEATEGDRAVGIQWRYDSLAPGTWELEPPTTIDSMVTGASAAVRYVHLDEVRGYRSLSGHLTVRALDSSSVSGDVMAVLHQVGEEDSLTLTMTFDRIPLVADLTVCGIAPPAPDSQSTSAPPEV